MWIGSGIAFLIQYYITSNLKRISNDYQQLTFGNLLQRNTVEYIFALKALGKISQLYATQ